MLSRSRPTRCLLTFFVASVALLGSLAAAAAKSNRVQIQEPEFFDGVFELADCGSFQILDTFEVTFTSKLFFDKNGNLVRIVEQVYGTDTLSNSVTGVSYPGPFHNNVLVDTTVSPAVGSNNGIIFRLTIPGSGVVLLDVGRIVDDAEGNVSFEAGPKFSEGDLAGLCAALE